MSPKPDDRFLNIVVYINELWLFIYLILHWIDYVIDDLILIIFPKYLINTEY